MKKTFHWFLVLGMVAGLLAALVPTAGPVHAATLGWTTTALPSMGGNRVLNNLGAPQNGTIIEASPNYANDSTLWAAIDNDGDTVLDDLARSTNGGNTWAVADADGNTVDFPIRAIVASPFFATDNTVFVATSESVFRSTNGGATFSQLGAAQGDGAAGGLDVSSMDVSPNYDGVGEIAIGLMDNAPGVASCPAGPNTGPDCVRVWGRAGVLNWVSPAGVDSAGDDGDLSGDVTAIAYSPAFSGDGLLIAVASAAAADGVLAAPGTYLVQLVGTGSFWGAVFGNITIDTLIIDVGGVDQIGDGGPLRSASIALPSDYDGSDASTRMVWLGIDSLDASDENDDGIYRVTTSAGTIQNPTGGPETQISTVAYSGTRAGGTLLATDATAALGNTVYRSTNAFGATGVTFSTRRPIPGDDSAAGTSAGVASSGGTAFALVNSEVGRDGGFSRSLDGGNNWRQISLMRNVGAFITGAKVAGSWAVSPNFATSGHVVAAAADGAAGADGGEDAILFSENNGSVWQRTDSVVLNRTIEKVAFSYSPGFATDNTIYYADVEGNTLKRSTNGGVTWSIRSSVACTGDTISALLAVDANTILLGCNGGAVLRSINGGFLFSTSTGTGGGPVTDIGMSPNFSVDNTVVYGATTTVRISTNGGRSFSKLGAGAGAQPQVAFHPDYATNNMIYAGSASVGKGVQRWINGTSKTWLTIGMAHAGTIINGMGFSADGAMYVSDGQPFVAGGAGGIWSSVSSTAGSATSAGGIDFNQVGVATGGTNLVVGDKTVGLAVTETTSVELWTVESFNVDGFRRYTDTITNSVVPTNLIPADGTSGVGSSNAAGTGITGFTIGWDAVSGATGYQYQWGTSSTFSGSLTATSLVSGTRIIAEAGIVVAPAITGDAAGVRLAGTTYYWRVRVAKPVVGRGLQARA